MTRSDDDPRKRGKPRKGFGKDPSGEWKDYVDIPLSDSQKEGIKSDVLGGLRPDPTFVQAMLDIGYKLSFAPDGRGGGIIATATGKTDPCPNIGYSMSGRGPDVLGALAMLEYKVEDLCHWGAWLGEAEAESRQLKMWG